MKAEIDFGRWVTFSPTHAQRVLVRCYRHYIRVGTATITDIGYLFVNERSKVNLLTVSIKTRRMFIILCILWANKKINKCNRNRRRVEIVEGAGTTVEVTHYKKAMICRYSIIANLSSGCCCCCTQNTPQYKFWKYFLYLRRWR